MRTTAPLKKSLAVLGALVACIVGVFALVSSSCACRSRTPAAGPTIIGELQAGATVTVRAERSRVSPGTYRYQWRECTPRGPCSDIVGATRPSYVLNGSEVGQTIEVALTGTKAGSVPEVAHSATPVAPPKAWSIPCALTAAAEPCWASHTGVPGYTETQILAGQSPLRHVVGDITVTTPGAVISNEWIQGCIAVDAEDVTIEDSLIRTRDTCQGGNRGTASSAVNDGNGSSPTGLVIRDTEVDGMNAPGDAYGISGSNYTCLRCNVHGFSKNIAAGSAVLIQDTYSHDLSLKDQCSHSSTIYADSAKNVRVEHSYLTASGTSDGCITAAFMNGGSWSPPSGDTIDGSYLEGVSGADMQEGCGSTNIHVTDNAFSSVNGYHGTDYVYGFEPRDLGNIWSGNYIPQLTQAAAPPPAGVPSSGGCRVS